VEKILEGGTFFVSILGRGSSSLSDDVKIKSLTQIEEQLIGVLKQGPLTRDQLVKKLAIPRTTIYDGLKKLILRNEVKKNPVFQTERSRGRPQVLFSVLDTKE
jgi:predicted ArsR family transcriptional regulator